MAAKKKSASRKPAAKKKAPKAKRKTPVPAKKKAVAPRKAKAASPAPAKSPAIAEIDNRIAIVRNNLRVLVEQATSYSGASNEELISQRISDQEAKLEALMKQREELTSRT